MNLWRALKRRWREYRRAWCDLWHHDEGRSYTTHCKVCGLRLRDP